MVLTQPIPEEICPWIYTVSIPLWFSRNKLRKRHGYKLISKFPYHYGSHATNIYPTTYILDTSSFHTTMVLTQRLTMDFNELWKTAFPYHYGSHATLSLAVRRQPFCTVSIPLWFSRNTICSPLTPHQLVVSIPLWFSRNGEILLFT